MALSKVDIRPGVSILAVLRHLNYKPWFALGEFVDNALQSFLAKTGTNILKTVTIEINIDSTIPARISIKDDAFGIPLEDFPRAFKPASTPPDNTGLSEFGMGMKSAACWFSPKWEVRTSVIGEPIIRTVYFDIENMIADESYELSIKETEGSEEQHFTEVILNDVFHAPVKRTVYKIKSHLASIYRYYITNGFLTLKINGDILKYEAPKILVAPYFKDKEGENIVWRKDIQFKIGDNVSVSGFAAIRATGNTSEAGFSLFRRGRVIQGSADETYRPAYIFGNSNSYKYQRVFGELYIDGVEVSHTKDGFRWGELEQVFLKLLRENLDSDDMPLLRQAEGYRVKGNDNKLLSLVGHAVDSSVDEMKDRLPLVIPNILESSLIDTPVKSAEYQSQLMKRTFDISFRNQNWSICIEILNDVSNSEWLALSDTGRIGDICRQLNIQMSMSHPLMIQFAQKDGDVSEIMFRVGAALAIAEVLARDSGVSKAGTVRRNMNDILRDVFSNR
ncbi:ATP-binding protein [Cronobacter muytjensii]|uniref:ATP-binding protein n=1 Tax=Cronobacter muytjensii TaxID=413501 RepID=UPI0002840377|nr:ATP-binding protein [Cronobacter muytjensii]